MNHLTDNKNSWENMEKSTQRRVDVETQRDFFWMTDLQGNYGFYLKREKAFDDADNLIIPIRLIKQDYECVLKY